MKLSKLYKSLKKVTLVNVIRHVIQLIMGILIARWLGASDKGLLFIFTTIAASTSVILSFGFSNSIIYHCKKRYIAFNRGLLYLLFILSFQVLVLGLISIISGEQLTSYLFEGTVQDNTFINLLFVYCLVSLINYFINSYCLSFRYFGLYFITFAFSSLLVCLINIIGMLYWGFKLNDILLVFVITELLTAIYVILYILILSTERPLTKNNKHSVVRYAVKSYLGICGSTLSTNGDSFILTTLLPSEQIGIYSISKTFYRLLVIIPQTINGVLFGVFCDVVKADAKSLLHQLVSWFIIICLSILLISYFYLDNVILFLYGDSFHASYQPALVLICSACLITISSSINPYLLAFNRPLATSTITLCSATVSLTCSIYFIGVLGILGAAIATLLGAICTSLMRFYFYKKENGYLDEA